MTHIVVVRRQMVNILRSNILRCCSSLVVNVQASHPHVTTGLIKPLDIFNFKFRITKCNTLLPRLLFARSFVISLFHSFIHSVVCLRTDQWLFSWDGKAPLCYSIPDISFTPNSRTKHTKQNKTGYEL